MLRSTLVVLALLLSSPIHAATITTIDLPTRQVYDDWAGSYATNATRVLDYYGMVGADPWLTIDRISAAMAVNPIMRTDTQWILPEMQKIAAEQGRSLTGRVIWSYWATADDIIGELLAERPVFSIYDLDPSPGIYFAAAVITGYMETATGPGFGLDWGFGRYWYSWSDLDGFGGKNPNYGLSALWQVQVHQSDTDGPAPVPEPSTLLLSAIGIAAALVLRRKSAPAH